MIGIEVGDIARLVNLIIVARGLCILKIFRLVGIPLLDDHRLDVEALVVAVHVQQVLVTLLVIVEVLVRDHFWIRVVEVSELDLTLVHVEPLNQRPQLPVIGLLHKLQLLNLLTKIHQVQCIIAIDLAHLLQRCVSFPLLVFLYLPLRVNGAATTLVFYEVLRELTLVGQEYQEVAEGYKVVFAGSLVSAEEVEGSE